MGRKAAIQAETFRMSGELLPLRKAVAAGDWVPTRPMGGWLATYGKIRDDGQVEPTKDRDGQVFEAAKALGMIDWTEYLTKGRLNDTHTDVMVGLPTLLEFHDATTPLAKAHRKVGFWTEGHLFDRNDPRSWEGSGYTPTPIDLQRADYFWNLATLLKGLPRTLALSAEGKYLPSPCGSRIIYARVARASVCEVPKNPDTSFVPLALSSPLTMDMVGADPCATCSCPAGACRGLVKAEKGGISDAALRRLTSLDPYINLDRVRYLVRQLTARLDCSEAEAFGWLLVYITNRKKQMEQAHGQHRT